MFAVHDPGKESGADRAPHRIGWGLISSYVTRRSDQRLTALGSRSVSCLRVALGSDVSDSASRVT